MNDLHLARRRPARLRRQIEELEESQIVEVWQLGFGRKNLIPLWVGESDMVTPAFIRHAAAEALEAGRTFYSYKRGEPELRDELTRYMNRLHGTPERPAPIAVDRVTVTTAGMNGLMMTMECLLEQGDEIVAVTPVWPNIFAAARIMGAVPRPVALDLTPQGWSLDLDRLLAACGPRTKAMFINTPGNPTGWMMSADEQRAVLDFCRRNGIWLIADEVYTRFVYDRATAPSFLSIAEPEDDLIVVNSFSKPWAMTGWRLGWLTTSPAFGETLGKTVEFNTSGTTPFLQHAGVVAIRDGEPFVKEMVGRCRVGRDLVHQALSALPRVEMVRPRAAFYAFFKVDGVRDTVQFCKDLLLETDVGLAPGAAFGPGGEGCVRLCFASSAARLSEAMERLAPALR
ncbi:MAG: pyridoxal phosphate-dependent aminotransferase [Alphaproteobacteria bacterium]|nr:pyridoxal phosphate-dependent aminotransferase [Alphaproteobacteria bacterium]